MPLKSKLFTEDLKVRARLEACLVSDPAHVFQGHRGDHVGRIQRALIVLGAGVIDQSELLSMHYGRTTAGTVEQYKQNYKPPIINWSYQKTADDIVGKMTIARLDDDMYHFENRPEPKPAPFSIYVSLSKVGDQPHNHDSCPTTGSWIGRDGHVVHLGTPIYPKGTGRKINIWGEGETNYLGFEDYVTELGIPGPVRPLTQKDTARGLPDACASDICVRNSPINKTCQDEIRRIAMPRCRFTWKGTTNGLASVKPFLDSLGTLIEKGVTVDEDNTDENSRTGPYFVIEIVPTRSQ